MEAKIFIFVSLKPFLVKDLSLHSFKELNLQTKSF